MIWKRNDASVRKAIAELDRVGQQMTSLFRTDSSFLPIDEIQISNDHYQDFGGGVFARHLIDAKDIRDDYEKSAAEILEELDPSVIGTLLFVRFVKFGYMLEQWHKVHEIGYVLSGSLSDKMTGKDYVEGEIFHFDPKELHKPFSPTGAFILLNFTNSDYL